MKFGSPVIYLEGGKEYVALVVGERSLKHHHGANNEPLLNLIFVKEVRDGAGEVRKVTGTVREGELVQSRHDIAHKSHSFSEEAAREMTDNGSMYPGGSIPGGRWREVDDRSADIDMMKKPVEPAGDAGDSGSIQ